MNSKPYALITGASSGLGISFAYLLAARGYSLILTARREKLLNELKHKLNTQFTNDVVVIPCDLSSRSDIESLLTQTHSYSVDILINNAGFGLFGEVLNHNQEQIEQMIQVNISSLTKLCLAFAKQMKTNGSGKILNIGSLGAYMPTPHYSAYCATKSYVMNFSLALRQELKAHGVKICVLNPGAVDTEFFQVSGQKITFFQKFFMMQPRDVARIGLNKLFKGKAYVVPGIMNKVMAFTTRLFPRMLQAKLARLAMKN